MHESRPSQTASMVAVWRALADDGFTSARGFSDPVARQLLSPGWHRFYRFMRRMEERARPEKRAMIAARLDIMPLRTLAIDAELERAIAAGCRQVVILGAGLDSRAYRLGVLAGCDVFEVDHPNTQGWKRRRAETLPRTARALHFVSVDFEHEDLVARLAASGHRAAEPTVWVWEGVVMYLTLAALRGSLAAIARSSAPGSTLLLHYHTPNASAELARERRIRNAVLALVREPMIGLRTPEDMRAEVTRAGLVVEHDAGSGEWVERFGASPLQGTSAAVTHLMVARRP
jgi:methyltransferase (TIGR00027 family)